MSLTLNIVLNGSLPLVPHSDVLWTLSTVNHLSLKQNHHLRGRQKNAIASSDITKAPFV